MNALKYVYILSAPLRSFAELNPSSFHDLVTARSVCEGTGERSDEEVSLWVMVLIKQKLLIIIIKYV